MAKKVGIIIGILMLVIIFLSASFMGGFLLGTRLESSKRASSGVSLDLITEVFKLVRFHYVEPVSSKKLEAGAIRGMLEVLDDPYTHYLRSSEFQSLQEHTMGHFFGVGIEIGLRNKKVVVISPIQGTPAEKAGLKAGDKVVEIDGKSTKGLNLNQVVKRIRGPEGTRVVLTIERKGEAKPLEFKLTRTKISIPNLSSKILDKDIGYVYLHTFNGGATRDLKKAITKLTNDGAKGLILDLRNNPGGSLEESIGVGSIFVESGPIVKIKKRSGKTESRYALGRADQKIPLVVLVNEGSASASEIVAGAIQDTKRGTLIGEKTFGKGSVQTVIPLGRGEGGLIITTDSYLTPKGRAVNKKGITPEIIVPMGNEKPLSDQDVQFKRAKEILREKSSRVKSISSTRELVLSP